MMKDMETPGKKSSEATREVEQQWAEEIWKLANVTLIPKTKPVSSSHKTREGAELTDDSGTWATTFPTSRESRCSTLVVLRVTMKVLMTLQLKTTSALNTGSSHI